jgi:hypothetical protein
MAEGCEMCTDLRVRLMTLRGDVLATAVVLGEELERPTQSRRITMRTTQDRLHSAAAAAIGG